MANAVSLSFAVGTTSVVEGKPCYEALLECIQAIWNRVYALICTLVNHLLSWNTRTIAIQSPDSFHHILKYLGPDEVARCNRVCKAWKIPDKVWRAQCEQEGIDPACHQGRYKEVFPELLTCAFGAKEWKQYFGVDTGTAPRFPARTYGFLSKLKEKHTLTLIPATIDGKELCFNTFTPLARQSKIEFSLGMDVLESKYGDEPMGKSQWIWMQKEIEPDAIDIDPNKAMKDYPQKIGKALWITVSMVAHYVRHKIRLSPKNYILTCDLGQNKWGNFLLVVDHLFSDRLHIACTLDCYYNSVVPAMPAEVLSAIGT